MKKALLVLILALSIFKTYSQNKTLVFDEKVILEELMKKGIPQIEYAGILRCKRIEFLNAQNGTIQNITPYFSNQKTALGPCDNAGFEDNMFTNWSGATGTCSVLPTTWTPGFVTGRHTILTGTGFDPIAIDSATSLPDIPLVAPGGLSYSARLGNDMIGAETEYLRYVNNVTTSNTSFTYQYAVVFENPAGHTLTEQPRFDFRIYDALGIEIPAYTVGIEGSAAATDSAYKPFYDSFGTLQGYYKKWSTVIVDLTPYLGTTVTIEFQSSDCTLTGHFGYAYIDANCNGENTWINNNFSEKTITVFPNPSKGQFIFSNLETENVIQIYDVTGKLIYSEISKGKNQSIDLSYKEKGIYFYSIIDNNKNIQQGKIIVQ